MLLMRNVSYLRFEWSSCCYRAAEGERVGILEVIAKAEAARKCSDAAWRAGKLAVDIECGGLPFHIAGEGKNDFDLLKSLRKGLYTFYKLAYGQIARAYSGYG